MARPWVFWKSSRARRARHRRDPGRGPASGPGFRGRRPAARRSGPLERSKAGTTARRASTIRAQKTNGIVVGGVDPHFCERPRLGFPPLLEQRCLAEPRRRGEQHEGFCVSSNVPVRRSRASSSFAGWGRSFGPSERHGSPGPGLRPSGPPAGGQPLPSDRALRAANPTAAPAQPQIAVPRNKAASGPQGGCHPGDRATRVRTPLRRRARQSRRRGLRPCPSRRPAQTKKEE